MSDENQSARFSYKAQAAKNALADAITNKMREATNATLG